MSAARSLVLDVRTLRRQIGGEREISGPRSVTGLELSSSRVVGDLDLALCVTRIIDGFEVAGIVRFTWQGECRRCLEQIDATTEVEIGELFVDDPVEGETYPVTEETVDLEPVVRDAVLLALPLAPLCRIECAGPAPESFPTGELPGDDDGRDPRWAALDQLDFD